MTTILTRLPIATEPWERARSLFLEHLSPDERTLFEDANLDTIYHNASVSHRQHQHSSKLQGARRRLAPLVDAIDGYGKGLDVMSNTPVAAAFLCPIWGGIRVALYVAQETEKYFEKLAEMLEKIGRTLPLFRDYQHLFPSHERLLQVLSEAYLDVLRFCTDVTALFKEAKTRAVSVVSLTVSCKTLWRPFTLRFAEYLKKFTDLKQQIQDEASVAHMIESKRERELQERSRALEEARSREEKLRQTLQRFSPIDYHLTHRRLRSECHNGTTQWIFDHDSYKSWREAMASSSIHCNGIPGSGKTLLASSIVDDLTADPVDPSHLICFHYCDYADHQTLDPAIMLGTFIRQILERSHHAEGLRGWVLNQWANHNSSPLAQELLPVVLETFERFEQVTIVIDALDELSPHDQHVCGSIISTFLGLQACRVKVFISCRFEAIILKKVPQPRFSIALSPELLSKDIRRFVEDTVQEKIDSKDLTIQDLTLQQEINDKLQEGAKDMFLWVKFQIAELCECMSDTEIRSSLENLPRDLAGTYRRILYKISCSGIGYEKRRLARRAFIWIICAKRPLTIEELTEAVVLEKSDKSFPEGRTLKDGGTRLRRACGNLVVFDEKHRLVRLAHHTVQQFFTDWSKDATFAEDEVVTSFRFTMDEAEVQTYALCLTYLCFSDFESQIIRLESQSSTAQIPGGLVPSLINYMLPYSGTIGRLTSLLKGQSHSKSNLNKLNLSIPGKSSRARLKSELKRKYYLLDYISVWWCFHSPSRWDEFLSESPLDSTYERVDMNYFRQKTKFVCQKEFAFPHLPWENDSFRDGSQILPLEDISLFCWAARSGKFGLWNICHSFPNSQNTGSRFEDYIRQAMLHETEERVLLADILHGGCTAMLQLYFSAVRRCTIESAIPAWTICQALRLSPKGRHAALFAELTDANIFIARGPPLEKQKGTFWRKETTSGVWLDSEWSATNMSGFDNAGGTFLLEEAVKQDDIDLVRCILENDVGRVVYFGSIPSPGAPRYVEEFITAEESPLARAAYENNTTMVEFLFSYINGISPSVEADIEDFDIDDLYEELEKRELWLMRNHVQELCRTGTGYPRIDTPNTARRSTPSLKELIPVGRSENDELPP